MVIASKNSDTGARCNIGALSRHSTVRIPYRIACLIYRCTMGMYDSIITPLTHLKRLKRVWCCPHSRVTPSLVYGCLSDDVFRGCVHSGGLTYGCPSWVSAYYGMGDAVLFLTVSAISSVISQRMLLKLVLYHRRGGSPSWL